MLVTLDKQVLESGSRAYDVQPGSKEEEQWQLHSRLTCCSIAVKQTLQNRDAKVG